MRTVLICHAGDALNREGLARWLASFTDLVGIVVLHESSSRKRTRIRKQIERDGWLRLADVTLFRIYYRLFLAARDRAWAEATISRLKQAFPSLPDTIQTHTAETPNAKSVREFLQSLQPDVMIARCKILLKESVFSIPSKGTFVMHPGICPEYRNAHGCFWALANGDDDKVGMTLLRIDRGVDTGPVYGHFYLAGDSATESHVVIQQRVVFDNLDAIRAKLEDIDAGTAEPIDTSGRKSAVWGQPWLTKYLAWKRRARRLAGPS